jgi:glycerol uptake facilitator-like aquaporin
LLAEAVGTFFLVSAAAGGEVVAVASKGQLGTAAKVAAPGIVVMAFIYALGDVSGAHFNPVVTLAFAVRGVFRWSCVPAYWIVQLAAAAVAALGLRALFGDVAHLGAPKPHVTEMKAVSVEAVLTLLLVLVILNTATRARVVGPNAAIAVGATIALCAHRRTHIWRRDEPRSRARPGADRGALDARLGIRARSRRRRTHRSNAHGDPSSSRHRGRGRRCRRGR